MASCSSYGRSQLVREQGLLGATTYMTSGKYCKADVNQSQA